MATLQARLDALATAIGTDVKDIYTKQGNLATLDTTDQSSLVNAINEVLATGGSPDAILYTVQTPTAPEQAIARTNIDAYGSVELGNPDTNLVTIYNTAKA